MDVHGYYESIWESWVSMGVFRGFWVSIDIYG